MKKIESIIEKGKDGTYTIFCENEMFSGVGNTAEITGIHQKQLWSYLHGKSKPRKSQIVKIENGLHQLGQEFLSVSL
jgi:hypothetical protein